MSYSTNFHDITSGSTSIGSPNYSCGVGYDLVTGIGTPIANVLIPALALYGLKSATAFAVADSVTNGVGYRIVPYSGNGEIVLQGSAYYSFSANLVSTWDVLVPLIVTQSFSWDNRGSSGLYTASWLWSDDPVSSETTVSDGPIVYWWRVTGECIPLNTAGCPTGLQLDNNCSVKYTYHETLTAYDLGDLCTRLKKIFLTYPLSHWGIEKIERWKRPLRTKTDAAQENDCNYLIEQPDVCNVPECLDFCLISGIIETNSIGVNTFLIPVSQYAGTGVIVIQGAAKFKIAQDFTMIGQGKISLLGQAEVSRHTSDYNYEGSGQISLGGSANLHQKLTYIGNGKVSLGGSVYIPLTWQSDDIVSIGATMSLEFESISSPEGATTPIQLSENALSINISTDCVCNVLPNFLYFYNNLNKLNKLSNFIAINSLTIPVLDSISYSNVLNGWQKVYHYRGNGLSNNTTEDWLLRAEWLCTDTLNGEYIGTYSWEFNLLIKRMIYSQSGISTYSTRINVNIQDNNQLCSPFSNILKTKFYYNPVTNLFTTDQNVAITGNVVDNIGVIGSTLFIQISSRAPNLPAPTMSLGPFLPKQKIFGN